jgi:hypothetical protein
VTWLTELGSMHMKKKTQKQKSTGKQCHPKKTKLYQEFRQILK